MKKLFLVLVFSLFLVAGLGVAEAASLSDLDLGPISYDPSSSRDLGESTTVKFNVANTNLTEAITLDFSTNELKNGAYTLGTPVIQSVTIPALSNVDVTFSVSVAATSKKSGIYPGTVTMKNSDDASDLPVLTRQYNINVKDKTALTGDSELETAVPADETEYSESFIVTNTGSVSLSGLTASRSIDGFKDEDDNEVNTQISIDKTALNPGESATVTVKSTVPKKMIVDTYSGNITVSSSGVDFQTKFIVLVEPRICKDGRVSTFKGEDSTFVTSARSGVLTLSIDEPDDGDEIEPGDELDLEINIENNDRDNDYDVVVEAILYDMEDDEEIVKVESDVISLDESGDDDDEANVDLTLLVPYDIQNNDLKIFVMVYEEDDEDKNCNYDSIELDFSRERDVIAVTELNLDRDSYTCGDTVNARVDLLNIGTRDQDDVLAMLESSELDVDLISDSQMELKRFDKSGDSATQLFSFVIPFDADEKQYALTATAKYDGNEESSPAVELLTVNNCVSERATVSLPQSEVNGAANSKVNVPLKIMNNLDSAVTYTVETLSTVADNVQKQISVAPNQEVTSFVELTLNDNLEEGSYTVSINLKANGEIVDTKQVSVVVGKSSGFAPVTGSSVSGLFGGTAGKALLIAGNVILVILVILLIVAVVRKGPE